MTPCFLHTPNMTNKWGTFKPGEMEDGIAEGAEEDEPLFVKDCTLLIDNQVKNLKTSYMNQPDKGGAEVIKLEAGDIYLQPMKG